MKVVSVSLSDLLGSAGYAPAQVGGEKRMGTLSLARAVCSRLKGGVKG